MKLRAIDFFATPSQSLDIIKYFEDNPRFGPRMFRPKSTRTDLVDWMEAVRDAMRIIIRPRYMLMPLPEFSQQDAREAFIFNHEVISFSDECERHDVICLCVLSVATVQQARVAE